MSKLSREQRERQPDGSAGEDVAKNFRPRCSRVLCHALWLKGAASACIHVCYISTYIYIYKYVNQISSQQEVRKVPAALASIPRGVTVRTGTWYKSEANFRSSDAKPTSGVCLNSRIIAH